jgi:hypothetical protein
MLNHIRNLHSLSRNQFQYLSNKIFSSSRRKSWCKSIIHILYILSRFGLHILLIININIRRKRRNASQKFISEHSYRPNIHIMITLNIPLMQLRSHIIHRPTISLTKLIRLQISRPPKITQFNRILIINQYILRLKISMHNPLIMQSLQSTYQLSNIFSHNVHSKSLLRLPK